MQRLNWLIAVHLVSVTLGLAVPCSASPNGIVRAMEKLGVIRDASSTPNDIRAAKLTLFIYLSNGQLDLSTPILRTRGYSEDELPPLPYRIVFDDTPVLKYHNYGNLLTELFTLEHRWKSVPSQDDLDFDRMVLGFVRHGANPIFLDPVDLHHFLMRYGQSSELREYVYQYRELWFDQLLYFQTGFVSDLEINPRADLASIREVSRRAEDFLSMIERGWFVKELHNLRRLPQFQGLSANVLMLLTNAMTRYRQSRYFEDPNELSSYQITSHSLAGEKVDFLTQNFAAVISATTVKNGALYLFYRLNVELLLALDEEDLKAVLGHLKIRLEEKSVFLEHLKDEIELRHLSSGDFDEKRLILNRMRLRFSSPFESSSGSALLRYLKENKSYLRSLGILGLCEGEVIPFQSRKS